VANTVYTTFKTALLDGTINLATANLWALISTSGYTPNYATDSFVSVIAPILSRVALTGITVSNGSLFANDPTFPAVNSGSVVTQVIVYINSGSDATSQLICTFNQACPGLPVATNDGNIEVQWVGEIFSL
jgi:hypothetical protein